MKIRPRTAAASLLVALALGALAGRGDSGFVEIEPGPTPDTDQALTVTSPVAGNPNAAAGRFLITTITARPLSRFEALRCQLRPPCTAVATPDAEYVQDANGQMRESVRIADLAAVRLAGPLAKWPAAPGLGRVDGIGGPSAGLALTLHLLQQRVPGDLTGGHVVAATGTISSTGAVGAVGGVPYKATGAGRAGADVLFVPAVEEAVAKSTAPSSVTVVPVTSAKDAISWLCEHRASSALCGAEGPRSEQPVRDALTR